MTARYDVLSRYAIDATGQQAFRGGTRRQQYTVYVVKDGDTMENIATRHLGNPLRFWEIADMNPQVKFPLDLTTGLVLRLPA